MQHVIDRHEQRLNRRTGGRTPSSRTPEARANVPAQVQAFALQIRLLQVQQWHGLCQSCPDGDAENA